MFWFLRGIILNILKMDLDCQKAIGHLVYCEFINKVGFFFTFLKEP